MDQSRRTQGPLAVLAGERSPRQSPQVLVYDGHKALECLALAAPRSVEEARYLADIGVWVSVHAL
jgi:hypothetical protein